MTRANRIATHAWHATIALIYLFLLAPIIIVVIVSFDRRPYLAFPPASFSFDSYAQVLVNPRFVNAFWVSLVAALAVAALAVAIGVMVSLALVRHRFRLRAAAGGLFVSPLLVPHIVLAVGIMLALAPFGLLDTYAGLILAHVGITVPYTIRTISMSLAAVDLRCEEAARVLGASPWMTFRRITLPLIRPGLLAGAVIAFLVSFDEAVIALFVVSSRTTTLPAEIYRYVETRTDPQVAALSVLLILVSVAAVVVIERAIGLRRALR